MGKIVEYRHHGALVKVDEDLKGKHREYCLCWRCENFRPGGEHNCKIAGKVFTVCVGHDLVTPVFECPEFVEGKPDLSALKE
jgi:hypothetical protein